MLLESCVPYSTTRILLTDKGRSLGRFAYIRPLIVLSGRFCDKAPMGSGRAVGRERLRRSIGDLKTPSLQIYLALHCSQQHVRGNSDVGFRWLVFLEVPVSCLVPSKNLEKRLVALLVSSYDPIDFSRFNKNSTLPGASSYLNSSAFAAENNKSDGGRQVVAWEIHYLGQIARDAVSSCIVSYKEGFRRISHFVSSREAPDGWRSPCGIRKNNYRSAGTCRHPHPHSLSLLGEGVRKRGFSPADLLSALAIVPCERLRKTVYNPLRNTAQSLFCACASGINDHNWGDVPQEVDWLARKTPVQSAKDSRAAGLLCLPARFPWTDSNYRGR